VPHPFADVVDGGFDVFVDATIFVAARGFERFVDLMNGFVPFPMVAVDGVFETVFGDLEFIDGVFGAPILFGPFGMFEMIQGLFEFTGLSPGNAEHEGEGE
jgi:hypothetical protein